jgi:hypothetical protein
MFAPAGANPFELILLMLLGSGFGAPAGVPTAEDPLAAKVAPADCLFYMSWAGTEAPKATSGNHTEQMLAEPEIQAFLKHATGMMGMIQSTGLNGNDPNAQAMMAEMKKLSSLIQGKPGAIFVSQVQFNGNGPPTIKGGGLLRVEDDGPAIITLIEKFQTNALQTQEGASTTSVTIGSREFSRVQLGDPSIPAITWGLAGKYLIFGLGDGSAEELMQRARGKAPQWLTDVRRQLPVPRPSSVVYANVEAMVKIGIEQGAIPDADRMVSALGLDAIKSFASVNGLDEKGCLSRALLTVEGPGRGLLSWIDAKPLTTSDLELINQKSPVAIAFKLDAEKILDLWQGLLGEIEPRELAQMEEAIAQAEQELGIRLREDLLASLGDTVRIFAQPGPQELITGWTVAIQVRDRQRLEQVQEKIVATLKAQLAGAPDGAPTLRSSDLRGHTVHTLSLGPLVPVSPSWCITDNELFITISLPELQALIMGKDRGPSIAQLPELKQLFDNNGKNLALIYVDTQNVVETLIPLVKLGLESFPLPPGLPLDTGKLPSAGAILPHLQPTVAAIRRTDDGIEFVSYQTMPGGNIGASAPIAAALLLPAVAAARESAQRTQGSNNLKMIALAMHNHHDVYKAFPAGYNSDADGKPLLSWRVHILPFIEHQPLHDQFHLDEPWDSPHNKKLIAQMPEIYRAPGSKADAGLTNYLGVGGKDGLFVRPADGERLGTQMRHIIDGDSNTMMAVEVSDEFALIWSKPGDFSPNLKDPIKGLLGLHPGGFQAALADGSVRFLAETLDDSVLKGLFTKAGGENFRLP